jgi:uncharacterized protein YegJ (DUF2314 family)
MRLLALLMAAALMAAPVAACAQDAEDPSNIVEVAPEDVEIHAARETARQALPGFWARFDSDPVVRETGLLKVVFPAKGGSTEVMWVRELVRKNGVVTGLLDNVPTLDVGLVTDQPVTVDLSKVVDWGYVRDGKRWGFFTPRLMLKRLPTDQAAELGETFSPTPIEP